MDDTRMKPCGMPMTHPRPTNRELCEAYRALLTTAFEVESIDPELGLRATKAWRNKLWKKFKEIEARLCPEPPTS